MGMLCGDFWSIGWGEILVLLSAQLGALGTAIWSYFFTHSDFRNRDGTVPSGREKWQHIFALLAFYVVGGVVAGGVALVCFRALAAF